MSTAIPTNDLQPGTLTVAQAAARLGIHEATAYRLIQADDFPIRVLRIGRRLKISAVELERYLAGEEEQS